MRLLRLALLPGVLLVAVLAERASGPVLDTKLLVADGVVGVVLVTCGVIAWDRRSESRVGPLMVLSGFTWFAGNFVAGLIYLHRGPLVHLHISYPTGRLRRWLAQVTVLAAYIDAVVEPIARNDYMTLVLTLLITAAAIDGFVRASGTARRAGLPALAAALAFAFVLGLGAVERLAGWEADTAVLWAYDIVIASLAVVLLVDLLRGRWAEAVVADLVVDLGKQTDTLTLRDELRRALDDKSLLLGYWLPERNVYVDDSGQPIEIPSPGSGRHVTRMDRDNEPLAILVSSEAVLEDPALVDAVTSVASIAVSNARLQAEVRAKVSEIAASRRRVVEVGDRQRRLLERDLRVGVEGQLAVLAGLLEQAREAADEHAGAEVAEIERELADTRGELRNLAQGVHPRSLSEGGLAAALPELAARAGLPVELDISAGRMPEEVEVAIYFLCSEALTNAAKHSKASRVLVNIILSDGSVLVSITDDGIGGAEKAKGSGLLGLTDRVEAIGGRLSISSPTNGGTQLDVTIPVVGQG